MLTAGDRDLTFVWDRFRIGAERSENPLNAGSARRIQLIAAGQTYNVTTFAVPGSYKPFLRPLMMPVHYKGGALLDDLHFALGALDRGKATDVWA